MLEKSISPRSAPQLGIGRELKCRSALSLNLSIHSGSPFISEIWRTPSSLRPRSDLKAALSSSCQPNLYSSLVRSSALTVGLTSTAISALPCGFELIVLGEGSVRRARLGGGGGAGGIFAQLADEPVVPLALDLNRQVGAAGLDDPALVHDVDEVGGDVVEDALVVSDQEHPEVWSAQPLHGVGDGTQGVDVEARVGLVEDRDLGMEDAHLQDLGPLLLAARKAVVDVAGGERWVHLQPLHLLGDHLAELARRQLAAVDGLGGGAQEVVHGHAGDGGWVLEAQEHAGAGALLGLERKDVPLPVADAAGGDLVLGVAHQGVGQRALAGAVGAHQGVDFSLADGQGHAAEDHLALDAGMEVANFENARLLGDRGFGHELWLRV